MRSQTEPASKAANVFETLFPLVAFSLLPRHVQQLPIIDAGAHNGMDLLVPAAKLGHRAYAYEPSYWSLMALESNLRRSNISYGHWTRVADFRNAAPGTVRTQRAAVSDTSGKSVFLESALYGGVASTLGGAAAMPANYAAASRNRTVRTVRLDDELKQESDGIFLLKLDIQGAEYRALTGGADYLKRRRVYVIMLEFSPFLLLGNGASPLKLLQLLSIDLSYQCFARHFRPALLRNRSHDGLVMTLTDFSQSLSPVSTRKNKFGDWTDLTCVRLDLLCEGDAEQIERIIVRPWLRELCCQTKQGAAMQCQPKRSVRSPGDHVVYLWSM